ncbi:MAG TPA: GGDEF domain-containing protein [Polyangiaceae bacterium]|nr:GGDEF domain-containing protein [Polyangiaceae bacterium]
MTTTSSVFPAASMAQSSTPQTPTRFEQRTLTTVNMTAVTIPLPAQRDRAVLVRTDETHAGQVILADGVDLRIGRHPTSSLVIDDEGISRSHARIVRKGSTYFVEDLGSANGTYVNGVRVEIAAELADGSLLQLGPRVRFRFSVVDEHQERILRQLYESSVRDALTGVFNRAYFLERLSGELAYSNRHTSDASLLILDLDHFKKVNDTYGHPGGDAVLRTFAATVRKVLRVEDIFARYGGEEFIVLLRGIAIDGAARAAERLRRAVVLTPTEHEGQRIDCTVSIGCASLGCGGRTAQALIATADRRLYAAKHAGRDRVVSAG